MNIDLWETNINWYMGGNILALHWNYFSNFIHNCGAYLHLST